MEAKETWIWAHHFHTSNSTLKINKTRMCSQDVKTKEEKITEELDKLYPNAKSKTIVEYNGEKYQIRY